MKQIAQNKRHGTLEIASVPPPRTGAGMVLVKNYFSVISAGTEKTSLESRKSSLLQRARSNPEDVRKILEEMRRSGIVPTLRRVFTKLDTSAALGYSSAGIVLAVDRRVGDVEIGDRVACAGAEYAHHADIVAVPRQLVAKIPDGLGMESAAYTTIGAIALQGVRQAAPSLGEIVAVIGLGLLGQLTVQILKANGCRVIGIDIDLESVERARAHGADLALHRSQDDVENAVNSITDGYGVDAVIITAGTPGNDPLVLAGAIARERGRVVLVGSARIDIPRDSYYRKEIEIRLSRSYGPGRYDPSYEEDGRDYPISYVRWTENRNMRAFLDLSLRGKITTEGLTTHRFRIDEAEKAYTLLEDASVPHVGIVLSYDDLSETELTDVTRASVDTPAPHISPTRSSLTVGFIGAGNFARTHLLPPLQAIPDVTLDTVCNKTGLTASDASTRFQFRRSTTNPDDIFRSDTIGTVFIATRHGEHAEYVCRALRNGQHVFVEKPLALNEEELDDVESLLKDEAVTSGKIQLLVGYNRRFAPLVREMKAFFGTVLEPAVVQYYVNAGKLPKEHWTHHPVEGGGRIIGEVCHFVDAIQYLTDASPVRVHAERIASDIESNFDEDSCAITLRMNDGSLGVITYVANGDVALPKERIVMSRGNASAVLDNFTSLVTYRHGRHASKRGSGDKGHRAEIASFIDAVRHKRGPVIPYESLVRTTRTTFRIVESLVWKQPVSV